MKVLLFVLCLLCNALISARASGACSTPCGDATGEVALPANAALSLPFGQGENVKVQNSYGPSGGVASHCRSQDTSCINDYFALDMVLTDHPQGGLGQPVLAVADGTVVAAGWATTGWAGFGLRVYLEHDFSDGHKYVTSYAHLHSITVTRGQKLAKGQQLGTLGHSSKNVVESPDENPVLHFAMYRDPVFSADATGNGDFKAGRAVRPEPLDGYSNLIQGMSLVSANAALLTNCEVSVQPTGETILEEDGPCAAQLGQLSSNGMGSGAHAFSDLLESPDPSYSDGVVWRPNFAQAGRFRVSAWIDAGFDSLTPEAIYEVQHTSGASQVTLNQAAGAGAWIPVGTFDFASGTGAWVLLADRYASSAGKGNRVVFDAIKFAPVAAAGAGGGAGATGGSGGVPDVERGDSSGCHTAAACATDLNDAQLLGLLAFALLLRRRVRR